MCGICGIYHFDSNFVDPEVIERMTKIVRHRGPDDEGYFFANTYTNQIRHAHHNDTVEEIRQKTPHLYDSFKGNLAFGYRRLSIIDLSPNGHQPMANRDESLWIITGKSDTLLQCLLKIKHFKTLRHYTSL